MIIDGKKIAEELRKEIAEKVASLKQKPGLAVVLVGEDPASQVYVKNKIKMTEEVGMKSLHYSLPQNAAEADLLSLIDKLNNNPEVSGILVQLPLPKHISENRVIWAIAPEKDVDGFHPINVGLLATGSPRFVPCTPLGCKILLKKTLGNLGSKHAIVMGRSNIVGKPMAQLLLQENCTVTIVHSKTSDIECYIKSADILVAAIGSPGFVKAEWIRPGATIIDVGINRLPNGKLAGDVEFEKAKEIASHITPVPGGVGPMTIACLLGNTLDPNFLLKR